MPRRRTQSSFRPLSLDGERDEPLHRQLYDELRRAILDGRIPAGSRLPASRELSSVSRVSRNTVLSAYEQLLAEGYIESRAGSGTFVADAIPEKQLPSAPAPAEAPEVPAARRLARRGEIVRDTPFARHATLPPLRAFRPGLPALDHFPLDLWRRLTERRMRHADPQLLAYGDAQGYLPLREAIAHHLSASRGVRCDASNIVVMNGAQQAINSCLRLLTDPGDSVWMEDPGYFAARAVIEATSARAVPVPVDAEGLDVAEGIRLAPHARLAYCTPSHQNPTGVTLSLARRMALLQWARTTEAWIVEDDNASEYRYLGRPFGALQGIDPSQRVIYIGTFSKVMFSTLRIGYAVLPHDLVGPFVRTQELGMRGINTTTQAVLADFMHEGHFARHVRRMRTLYQSRLVALERAVEKHAADLLELLPIEGGLNRLALLPAGMDDTAASEALFQRGILAAPLSASCLKPRERGGLVLGFAAVDESEMPAAVERLAATLRTLPRRPPA